MIEASSPNAVVSSLIVRGDSNTPSVLISGGSVTKAEIFGGNISALGNAQALNNSVSITDASLEQSSVYGASLSLGNAALLTLQHGVTATATGNTVSIGTSSEEAKTLNVTASSLIGAQANLVFDQRDADGSAANAQASAVSLSNNNVTVGNNVTLLSTENSDKDSTSNPLPNLGGNVIGAVANSNVALGSLSLTNNTVTFNGSITGNAIDPADTTKITLTGSSETTKGAYANGLIIAARATGAVDSLTLANNSVTVNGSVRDGLIIGAYDGVNNEVVRTVTGNSVTIGATAQITNSDIYAVRSDSERLIATNNDVVVQGKVKDSSIYGGMGADSAVSLETGSNYSVSQDSYAGVYSDVVNLSGQVEIGSNATLAIHGFLSNGKRVADGEQKYNSNLTTVNSSAKIYNRGNLELYGKTTVADGATLSALSTNANIKVDGSTGLRTDLDSIEPIEFRDFVADGKGGQLIISNGSLQKYLTAGDLVTVTEGSNAIEDFAGSVDVTSGGVLEFTDASTTLSDYEFVSATTGSTAGKITVDTSLDLNANKGSIFRGNEINVAHKFASNTSEASGDYTKLSALTKTAGIQIEANTLNLGATDLSSTRSESIQFGKAIVRDEINFLAATSGNDVQEDGTAITGKRNDGYHLTSEVVGSHYMLTNSQDGKLQYYTAQNGVVNGPVTITAKDSANGSLTIRNGNWTANGQITVASGGSFIVGGDDGIKKPNTITEGPDATLTLNQSLVLDVSETSGDAKVTVSGNGGFGDVYDYVDELDGTISAPTKRVALLDLRNGLTMQGAGADNTSYLGKAIITADHGGIVLLNADDVNTILAQNDKAVAHRRRVLIISPDL